MPPSANIASDGKSARAHILQHRAELGLSLRVTVAALSSFGLSHLLNVPLPLWAVLTAVILTQMSFGKSLKATIDYLLGTLFGAVYAGAVGALIPHANDIALAVVLAISVAPLALLGAINPSFSAATFTGVLVTLVPGFAHVSPIESALYRVVEVAVGGFTALAVSLVVWPARAHSFVIEAAAAMLDLSARSLPELFVGLTQRHDAGAIRLIHDGIGEAFARLSNAAAEARHEQIGFLATGPDTGPLLRVLLRLRHDFVMIGRAASEPLPETFQARLGPLLARVAETAADHLRESAEALVSRRQPPSHDAAEAALDDYAEALAAARGEGLTKGLPAETVERIFTLGFALDQLRQNLRDLDVFLSEAAQRR